MKKNFSAQTRRSDVAVAVVVTLTAHTHNPIFYLTIAAAAASPTFYLALALAARLLSDKKEGDTTPCEPPPCGGSLPLSLLLLLSSNLISIFYSSRKMQTVFN